MKQFLDFFFHRHAYDPSSWKEVARINDTDRRFDTFIYVTGSQKQHDPKIIETRILYTNTCLTCGDLTERIAVV